MRDMLQMLYCTVIQLECVPTHVVCRTKNGVDVVCCYLSTVVVVSLINQWLGHPLILGSLIRW